MFLRSLWYDIAYWGYTYDNIQGHPLMYFSLCIDIEMFLEVEAKVVRALPVCCFRKAITKQPHFSFSRTKTMQNLNFLKYLFSGEKERGQKQHALST